MSIYDTCSGAQWTVSIASLIGLAWMFFEMRYLAKREREQGDREGFARGYELGVRIDAHNNSTVHAGDDR